MLTPRPYPNCFSFFIVCIIFTVQQQLQSHEHNNQIKNAISTICLAGPAMASQRQQALAALEHHHSGQGMQLRVEAIRELSGDVVTPAAGAAAVGAGDVGAVGSGNLSTAVSQFIILFFHSKTLSFRYACVCICMCIYVLLYANSNHLPLHYLCDPLKCPKNAQKRSYCHRLFTAGEFMP